MPAPPCAGPGSVEDTFCLSFEAGVPGIGEPISLPLRGDGCEAVTEDNRRAYVDAYVDCVLNSSIHKQARAWASCLLCLQELKIGQFGRSGGQQCVISMS